MTMRTYKIVTNVCFIAGIGSILMLGRFAGLQWVLVLVAILAGAGALGLHVYGIARPLTEQGRKAVSSPVPTARKPEGHAV
jgi:UPF0716 family protein affecting phage T7 exclusion